MSETFGANIIISKRQSVELREIWPREIDFSDWLASEAGLKMIASYIGIEVEDARRESSPGDFRCDIVGHKLGDENHVVVIENQYNKTDHDHLGKMLTYAAVHDATTGIWISERVSDDHRQVIDWLNSVTPANVNFYLAQIRAYRIDNSAVAPELNVVCRPNLKTKPATTKSGNWNTEFWEDVLDDIKGRKPSFNVQSPGPDSWTAISVGRSGFRIALSITTKQPSIRCELNIDGPPRDSALKLLLAQKDAIENEIGGALEWLGPPETKIARIRRGLNIDPKNPGNRQQIKDWMFEQAELFYRVFRPRIQNLSTEN